MQEQGPIKGGVLADEMGMGECWYESGGSSHPLVASLKQLPSRQAIK